MTACDPLLPFVSRLPMSSVQRLRSATGAHSLGALLPNAGFNSGLRSWIKAQALKVSDRGILINRHRQAWWVFVRTEDEIACCKGGDLLESLAYVSHPGRLHRL